MINCISLCQSFVFIHTISKLISQIVEHLSAGLHYIVGGRNINRYKPGGDWRWIKKGKMTKMSYFAFGRCQPNGGNSSPNDCMFFYTS